MEHSEVVQHSYASSARTIPGDDRDEEDKKDTVVVSEKGGEMQKDLAAVEPPEHDFGEHPDGGLRAWLVVIGVSSCVHTL